MSANSTQPNFFVHLVHVNFMNIHREGKMNQAITKKKPQLEPGQSDPSRKISRIIIEGQGSTGRQAGLLTTGH